MLPAGSVKIDMERRITLQPLPAIRLKMDPMQVMTTPKPIWFLHLGNENELILVGVAARLTVSHNSH
jgi:hypothetical protein